MRMNVDKVLERDQKLSQLDDRAGKCPLMSLYLLISTLPAILIPIRYFYLSLSSNSRRVTNGSFPIRAERRSPQA